MALIITLSITAYPSDVLAPMMPECVQAPVSQISRGEPAQKVERRVMRITAYTKNGKGMNGKGITTNGQRTIEGHTIAAPESIPFGTQINIPALGKTFTVTDRGGAIKGNRLDLFMESRKDAMEFGIREMEVFIRY